MSFVSKTKTALEFASTIIVIIAGLVVIENRHSRPAADAAAPIVQDVRDLHIDGAKIRNVVGNAKIAIVEFADYECPFCGRYARETFPQLRQTVIQSGEAQYVFVNFPLEGIHRLARQASEAAECAGQQGRYWEMHERLFADNNALMMSDILRYSDSIGLDKVSFERCLNGEVRAKVQADLAEGRRLGVTGTPTFFVGVFENSGGIRLVKRINGAAPLDTFKTAIEEVSTSRRARAQ